MSVRKRTTKALALRPRKLRSIFSYGYEFLLAPGEPWFVEQILVQPTSVWSAIRALREQQPDQWRDMARDLFELRTRKAGELLMPEGVLFMAVETDTVEPGNPARVWIDPEGKYTLDVWEPRGSRRQTPALAKPKERSKRHVKKPLE